MTTALEVLCILSLLTTLLLLLTGGCGVSCGKGSVGEKGSVEGWEREGEGEG